MIAGGSSESFVRVWSLIGENLRALDTRIESQSGNTELIKQLLKRTEWEKKRKKKISHK